MGLYLNLRRDLRRMSDDQIAAYADALLTVSEQLPPAVSTYWLDIRRGPIRHPTAYKLLHRGAFDASDIFGPAWAAILAGALALDAIRNGPISRLLDLENPSAVMLLACELEDVMDEIRRRRPVLSRGVEA